MGGRPADFRTGRVDNALVKAEKKGRSINLAPSPLLVSSNHYHQYSLPSNHPSSTLTVAVPFNPSPSFSTPSSLSRPFCVHSLSSLLPKQQQRRDWAPCPTSRSLSALRAHGNLSPVALPLARIPQAPRSPRLWPLAQRYVRQASGEPTSAGVP